MMVMVVRKATSSMNHLINQSWKQTYPLFGMPSGGTIVYRDKSGRYLHVRPDGHYVCTDCDRNEIGSGFFDANKQWTLGGLWLANGDEN